MSHTTAWFIPLFAIIAALTAGGVIIILSGYDAVLAVAALIDGALGSSYSLGETFLRSCPLILTGLAVSVAFRCGLWNIGAEGQFLMGALVAAGTAPFFVAWPNYMATPALLLSGVVAGALWGGIAGYLKIERHVPEVISTIMLNFVAIQLVGYAVHGPLIEASGQFPQSDPLAEGIRLSRWLPPTRLHTGFILAVCCTGLIWLVLFRTVFGYRIRAVGLNSEAARSAGIDTRASMVQTMCLSGGLAGLAGAVELSGVTYRIFEQFGGGYGYTAIGVALLARLHPGAVIPAALLFGALATGASGMQRVAGVSSGLVYIIQALILLFVVMAAAYERRWRKAV
ncbi:MAG: ABC transporter permease [Gemmatimonadota bacterium]|nr:ABC transporter permease [Gemmatimonadota bacterium]